MSTVLPLMDELATELASRSLACTIECPLAPTVALSDLSPGQHGIITGFTSDTSVLARRLFDQGFHPGLPIEFVRRAPLKDPLVVRIDGGDMVLRSREASHVLVALADSASAPHTAPQGHAA